MPLSTDVEAGVVVVGFGAAGACAALEAAARPHSSAALLCPAAPQTSQAITISTLPTRLVGVRCPASDGF